MPTALSQTHVYIYFIYKLNLHGCHHIIAFSLEKTSSSFQVKREGQQVAPGPNRAAVTDQHDGALHWGISQPCPTANPSLCDMIHKDPHAILDYPHVHHIAWYIQVHVLHTQIGSLMSWDSSSEVQEGTVRKSSIFLCVQLAHAGPLWFLTSGESVFFCISIPWAQEHNTHSLTATPILVKCNYISIFISVPCRISVPCKHMKTLRIIKLRSYISFSMFKHRN